MEFSEQLFKEVYHANNKLNMSMYIHNKFVDEYEVSQIAPTYFVLTLDAIDNDFVIRIAKTFDRTSYGTMFKFLNLVEANVHLFEMDNKKLVSQIKLIEKYLKKTTKLLFKT